MAIKIPSKNIYEVNNPKIRDNVIDNVSVEQTIVKPNNEYEVSVYNKKFNEGNDFIIGKEEEKKDLKFVSDVAGFTTAYGGAYSLAKIIPQYITKEIHIPILEDNKYISKIYNSKNSNNEAWLKYTIVYDSYFSSNASATLSLDKKIDATENGSNAYNFKKGEVKLMKEDIIGDLPSTRVYGKEVSAIALSTKITAKADLQLTDLTKIIDFEIKTENEEYIFEITILTGFEYYSLGASVSSKYDDEMPYTIDLGGEYNNYLATEIEITVYGNTIGIDLTNGSVPYGSGKKPYSLSGNELLQDSAYKKITNAILNITNIVETTSNFNFNKVYFDNVNINGELNYDLPIYIQGDNVNSYRLDSDMLGHFIRATKGIFLTFAVGDTINVLQKNPLTKIIAENVLRQYANGKETATLLCDIADYYDESGEKVIDIKTNNMSFRLHDEVIPYVFGAKGEDKPMSKYQDGTPKVFEVVGSNIIYDGAVWQELSLLEKTKNT